MGRLDALRKTIEEKKEKKKKEEGADSIDLEQVDQIVQRMKKKYSEEGIEFEEVGGKLKELRGIIAEGQEKQIEVQTVEDLKAFRSPAVQNLGKIYLKLSFITKKIEKFMSGMRAVRQLNYYLYSANMKYSAKQWLALIISGAIVSLFLGFFIGLIISVVIKAPLGLKILIPFFVAFLAALVAFIVGFMIPQRRAQARGDAISRELPFALRHMATELRAGIGLYRTLQTIASADYGDLSEEFARTITEIEEGTDTQLALKHFALRTQSKALRNALIHVIRALKSGGNLSEVMNSIAEDVAFDLRTKIQEFAEKMNFFGTIYIYMAIVVPVFVGILGLVKAANIGGSAGFDKIPLTPEILAIFYLLFMPMLLIYLM
ncbi:MAG: type II secretion system F family protein, partial [archaeon]|nr:type II secretion system F family protein [archaeon]